MRSNSTANRRHRPRITRWAAVGGVLLLAFLVNEVVGTAGYVARREQRDRIEALDAEIRQLRQENQRLAERIQALRSDPHAIEQMAREQLHLARPGEVVIALPPRSSPPAPQP